MLSDRASWPGLQAQESGAHAQMVDDALYALDGLVPGVSLQTLSDSAASIASIAASRRGLLALRQGPPILSSLLLTSRVSLS